jgi:3-hydroxy acid dehydrogenase / malonic semialdehyde reductase
MKTVFITGATSGIGEVTAILLAKEGFRLILCGRRNERLKELREKLSKQTEVLTLCYDVRDRKEVKKIIESLPDNWKSIDILINNAGNAYGLAPIQNGDIDDWDAMIDINVKGLLYVSRAIIPGMVERKKGHIINISSIAGKEVYPNGNIYCASKYAVDAISKSMLIDLNFSNIKVTSINPGLIETEFSLVRFKGDSVKAKSVYKDMVPLSAQDIAETIFFIITRPDHVKITDLTILPTAQASATIVNRNK